MSPGVPASWGPAFATYVERNVIATQRLLEAATAAGVRRFVYASSSSVYGPEQRPLVESAVPRPLSPYGASKLAGEVLVGAYAQERGLSTVSLRYFSVYGPRQRPDMAAHRFIEALLDHRPVHVYGDGRQARDFTYVADVVAATSAALTATVPAGSVFNIAQGRAGRGARRCIAILADELGVEPRIERRPPRAGDTPRTEGCATLRARLLCWEPVTDLRSGLRRQVEWHLRRRGLGRGAGPGGGSRAAPWRTPRVPARTPGCAGPSTRCGPTPSAPDNLRRGPQVSGAREPRLLIYSQDGFGLGHQRRTTLLADEFLRSCPGASALTVSDSPLGKFFSSAAGHDYCKLPSVRKVGPG